MQFDNIDFVLYLKITIDAFCNYRVDVTGFNKVISACKSLFTAQFTNSHVEFNRQQASEVAIINLGSNSSHFFNSFKYIIHA